MEIVIDNEKYIIEKANIDASEFDYDGFCEKYRNVSFVVIDDYHEEPRVRLFDGSVYDDNNHSKSGSFDPDNYSDAIHARLEYGDEAYIDELYTIISTTNKKGSVYYNYLRESFIHKDLLDKYAVL